MTAYASAAIALSRCPMRPAIEPSGKDIALLRLSGLDTQRRRRDEGFTLIELLVVIIIIGILAAIAIPVFLSQKTKAYEASEKADLSAVAGKMEIFYTGNFTYAGVPFGTGTGAGQTVTGSSQTVGPGEAVTLSKGNSVTLAAVGATGYCLSASNASAGPELVLRQHRRRHHDRELRGQDLPLIGAATLSTDVAPSVISRIPSAGRMNSASAVSCLFPR